jgi:endogenous inhibitor of DNA gyrase (YacG/DUF329 family)
VTHTDPIQPIEQGWTAACPRCDVPAEWTARSSSYTLHYSMNCPECGLVRWTPSAMHSATTTPHVAPKSSTFLARVAERMGLGQ